MAEVARAEGHGTPLRDWIGERLMDYGREHCARVTIRKINPWWAHVRVRVNDAPDYDVISEVTFSTTREMLLAIAEIFRLAAEEIRPYDDMERNVKGASHSLGKGSAT